MKIRGCGSASWLEIAKYWELLFNYILTNLVSRSKRGLQIITLQGSYDRKQTVCF